MKNKLKYLVVDSGAFIQKQPLWEHAEELYTVPEVLAEIKDKQTSQFIESFPVKVNFCQPQPASLKFISTFSKKSGDFHVLSLTDLKLLALTHELHVKENGSSNLRLEPLKRITNTTITLPLVNLDKNQTEAEINNSKDANNFEPIEEFNEVECEDGGFDGDVNNAENEDDGWTTITKKRKPKKFIQQQPVTVSEATTDEQLEEEEEDDEDDDDDEGWITPDNIDQMTSTGWCPRETDEGNDSELEDCPVTVACITVDYAMQHVLKHIGLGVLGIDGRIIKELRNFVLRCFTCFTVTPDMSLLFCPKCGHKTLKRVSITTNADGTQNIWISRRRLNTRGFKYNLPKPRGGQHALMPLLTADQRFPHQWAKKSKSVDALDPDFIAGPSPFAARDVNSRAAVHGCFAGTNNAGNAHPRLKHAKIWKPKRKKTVRK